jgi:hypothetical protein
MAFNLDISSTYGPGTDTLWGVPRETMLAWQAQTRKIMEDADRIRRTVMEPIVIDLTSPEPTDLQLPTESYQERIALDPTVRGEELRPEAAGYVETSREAELRHKAGKDAENYGKIHFVPTVPSLQNSLLNTPLDNWAAAPEPGHIKSGRTMEAHCAHEERRPQKKRSKRTRELGDDGSSSVPMLRKRMRRGASASVYTHSTLRTVTFGDENEDPRGRLDLKATSRSREFVPWRYPVPGAQDRGYR